ncbi:(2Fe-2S)-binding protein [Roseomonas sp. KE0001]|uniref:(2Fe-2S)-binding protein n=1 Tax=Roseomonas sp. KE0001 TaxID=2479201 RepID=UPI0018E0362F
MSSSRALLVSFSFDDEPYEGSAGDSLAVALMLAGRRHLRDSSRQGAPRGAFCLMGSCQECVVWVDGERRPACQVPLRQGMVVRSGTIGTDTP